MRSFPAGWGGKAGHVVLFLTCSVDFITTIILVRFQRQKYKCKEENKNLSHFKGCPPLILRGRIAKQTWLPDPTLSPLGSVNLDSFPKHPEPNSIHLQRDLYTICATHCAVGVFSPALYITCSPGFLKPLLLDVKAASRFHHCQQHC